MEFSVSTNWGKFDEKIDIAFAWSKIVPNG